VILIEFPPSCFSCFLDLARRHEPEARLARGDQRAVLWHRLAGKQRDFLERHSRRAAEEELAPWNVRHRVAGVLAVRCVHRGVRDHRNAGGLGEMADLHRCGDAADPGDVGLQDVDRVPRGSLGERRDCVPVLAGRQRLPRQALP
jgi:hypothetical protein